ncbi:MAG TPA: DUF4097 family beta strand repeat-containing protein [Acidimicrobiia bacterium]|nr:DUF4097 family beta strand repeat-containing protein [Acidimicrobiia bacterium]
MTTVSQQFAVGSGAGLNVKIQSGRVDIAEGPPGSISLEIETRDPDNVEIHQSGNTVYVSDNRSGWVVRGSVRLTAVIPARSDVEVGSASADIYVDAEVGALVCRTASGDLSFREADTLEVKTASGSIRGERVAGDVRVNSASGDVWIKRISGRLTAALASGDVRVEEVAEDLRANSASGDVRVDRFRGDEVVVKSVSGDLHIGFPRGITLDAEVNTLSGSVNLPVPPDPPSPPAPGETHAERPSGKRRVRLNAKTVSGDVRISTFND